MYKLGFIGLGNMGGSIVKGLTSSYIDAHDVYGYDISEQAMADFRQRGVQCLRSAHEVIEASDLIFICVKPQVVEAVVQEIKEDLKEKAIVSIVLGYDYEKYDRLLDASTRHLTIMPNTPVEVKEGMILFEAKHSLSEDEWQFVYEGFKSVGSVEVLASHLMAVGGALSGCGPAFIYMIIEALADGAVAKGLPRASAYKLASQTVLGAGRMQLESGLHPGVLKDNVTSPGGSTIRGVRALEDGKIRAAFMKAIIDACGE